jgi:hypothetical protein
MEAIVMSSEKFENKSKGMSGLVFVGCLMIGLAAGFVTGNFAASILGGLGIGFVAMGIAMAFENLKGTSGLVFVGCLLLGLGVGLFTGNVVVWLFGGLGIGFIAMFIAYYVTGHW